MSTTIPVVTKEDIWSEKDLQTIYNERYYNDPPATQESNLDQQVEDWIVEAQGYVKGSIIESYFKYIDTQTWRIYLKMYCNWQSLNMMYSLGEQELVNNSYLALRDYVNTMTNNVKAQAELDVIPNKHKNFKVY
jgi:hypothetical protein